MFDAGNGCDEDDDEEELDDDDVDDADDAADAAGAGEDDADDRVRDGSVDDDVDIVLNEERVGKNG